MMRLAASGTLRLAEIDTAHLKCDAPAQATHTSSRAPAGDQSDRPHDRTNPTGTNVATQPLSTFRATGTPPHQTAGGQADP